MSEKPRDRIEELLAACLRDDAPTAALERLCVAQPTLATALRRRFQLVQGMGLVADPGATSARRIGDFRLIRELGRGGMGVVWLAEQPSLGRKVALKLLRPGFGTEGLAKRLRHEAAVLGQLQHPGIAHVYEAGSAALDEGSAAAAWRNGASRCPTTRAWSVGSSTNRPWCSTRWHQAAPWSAMPCK